MTPHTHYSACQKAPRAPTVPAVAGQAQVWLRTLTTRGAAKYGCLKKVTFLPFSDVHAAELLLGHTLLVQVPECHGTLMPALKPQSLQSCAASARKTDEAAQPHGKRCLCAAHTRRGARHVLHLGRYIESEVCGRAARAPGDVAEGGPVRRHAVLPVKQVLHALPARVRSNLVYPQQHCTARALPPPESCQAYSNP